MVFMTLAAYCTDREMNMQPTDSLCHSSDVLVGCKFIFSRILPDRIANFWRRAVAPYCACLTSTENAADTVIARSVTRCEIDL